MQLHIPVQQRHQQLTPLQPTPPQDTPHTVIIQLIITYVYIYSIKTTEVKVIKNKFPTFLFKYKYYHNKIHTQVITGYYCYKIAKLPFIHFLQNYTSTSVRQTSCATNTLHFSKFLDKSLHHHHMHIFTYTHSHIIISLSYCIVTSLIGPPKVRIQLWRAGRTHRRP